MFKSTSGELFIYVHSFLMKVLVNAQKVNTVVTICAAFLPGGFVITMMTVKTIQMNVTVVRIVWTLCLTCSLFFF